MLARRETTPNELSQKVYATQPLSACLAAFKAMISEVIIMTIVAPFYSSDMGRPSEDPVLLTRILFLSFLFNIKGDDNILETLAQRLDWLQFCDLSLGAVLPDRTTLVKFRRQVGPVLIAGLFADLLKRLVDEDLVDYQHRLFDGTPVKALARIHIYRDEIYQEPLAVINRKLSQLASHQIELDFGQNPSPVELKQDKYAVDETGLDTRRSQPMKPVAERQSAGDSDARFQASKHGKPSLLGYENFFTTDGKEMFVTEVDLSDKPSQGREILKDKLEQSQPGQTWSVDAEFSTGAMLEIAEEKKVILNTPPRPVNSQGKTPKTEFAYDEANNTYTCPEGKTLKQVSVNKQTGDRTYRAKPEVCNSCPHKPDCTSSDKGRSINRSLHEKALDRNRKRAATQEAVMGRVLRGIIAEGKFAEAVRHGLKIMRYVGKDMAKMQATIIALILNMKRYLRVLERDGLPFPA